MDQSSNPRARADWNLVSGIYSQVSQLINDPHSDYLPPAIPGFLAEALSRAAAFYTTDKIQMAEDFLAVIEECEPLKGSPEQHFRHFYFDERPRRFDFYKPETTGRVRPTPFESSVETCRRLRDLQVIRDTCKQIGAGLVLGGSMSYGKFLNVSGAESQKGSSDIDLLFTVEEGNQLLDVAEALSQVPGISASDLGTMKTRVHEYLKLQDKLKDPCSFSQKVSIWVDQEDPWLSKYNIRPAYKISLHCFTRDGFEQLVAGDLMILSREGAKEKTRVLNDYRQEVPNLRLDHQRSLAGTDLFLDRPFVEVSMGYLTESRAFVMDAHGRYHPGMFQNLILPQFELVAEDVNHSLRNQLDLFRWKIVERLRKERQARPYELLRLSLSHTRSSVFAPHIVRQIDNTQI
ncbi:hypothetical protein [Streptomyces sp. NPDC051001]|uniref:hypothetical protein n=1 Tax=Streptomyces sp. NPDC051001 TaxID=3155795 RepID=UPI00343EAF83